MLRTNGHRGKVRNSDFVPVPDCAEFAPQTWDGARYVFGVPAGAGATVCRGGKVEPDFPLVHRRCGTLASAILAAVFDGQTGQGHHAPPGRDSAGAGGRSGQDARGVDVPSEKQGATWVITPCFWGAAGASARSPVRAARPGTTRPRPRPPSSVCAASVRTFGFWHFLCSAAVTAQRAGLFKCGQPCCPASANTFGGSEKRRVARGNPVRKSRPAFWRFAMGNKYKRLIGQIADIDNLRLAYAKTMRAKRQTWGYLEFKEYDHANLLNMRKSILESSYQQGSFRQFMVYEPKPRLISALDFSDRVAQHALVNIIGPIFEKTLLPGTFACREGMGTHAGVRHVQSALRRTGATHFLKTDYSKFFPSVDRAVLHGLIERKISCRPTLDLIGAMVPRSGCGIPIGSLTSQLFANVYGGVIDRFLQFELGAKDWTRYMDDVVVLSSNPYELRHWLEDFQVASKERLGLSLSKWQVSPVTHGINFLGYRIWPRHKLLRKQSVTAAKRKIAHYTKHGNTEALTKFTASWRGHAAHADTCNLFNHLKEHHGISCH